MSDPANLKIYAFVLVGLLVGTLLTVGAAQIDMGGPLNIIVGLLIAVAKASLVVCLFMHLKYEKRWWAALVLFPLLLVAIIIFSNFPDTALFARYEEKDKFQDGLSTPALKTIPKPGASGAH